MLIAAEDLLDALQQWREAVESFREKVVIDELYAAMVERHKAVLQFRVIQ